MAKDSRTTKEILEDMLEKVDGVGRSWSRNLPKKLEGLKDALKSAIDEVNGSESQIIKGILWSGEIDYGVMRKIAKELYPNERPYDLVDEGIKDVIQAEPGETDAKVYRNDQLHKIVKNFGEIQRKKLGPKKLKILEVYFSYLK